MRRRQIWQVREGRSAVRSVWCAVRAVLALVIVSDVGAAVGVGVGDVARCLPLSTFWNRCGFANELKSNR